MTSPQKRKGDEAERDFVKWLISRGYVAARRTRAGWDDDKGDINLGSSKRPLLIEVKNRKTLSVNTWLDEMEAKMVELGDEFHDAVLVVKRPGQADPGDWWAIRRVRDEF